MKLPRTYRSFDIPGAWKRIGLIQQAQPVLFCEVWERRFERAAEDLGPSRPENLTRYDEDGCGDNRGRRGNGGGRRE